MPVTANHILTATTPDDPAWEIRPSHWNSAHVVTLAAVGSEISGAFSNAGNVSFGLDGGGFITASANVTAAPSPVNVTGANGSSVNAQTIAFSNANGMTLGVSTAANGATVTGSYTVPTVPTAYVSSVNGSSGAISLNVGSSLSSSTNGSSITFGLASNITTALQSAGNYLTTAALSNHSHGFSAAGGSSAFQTLSFSNGGGVTFTNSAGQVAATVATTYRASNDAVGLNTAQSNVTWTVNSAGISLDARSYAGVGTSATNASITLNSNGLAISVANPGGGAGDGFNILAAGTQTAGTATTVNFANSNGITFGMSGSSQITASHNALTTARASNDAIGLNTAQTNVTWTVNSSGLSLNAAGYAGTTTAVTGAASLTLNSGGLQFNGAGLAGTSSGFTGANISATITHNTAGLALSMSVAAPGGGATPVASASNGSFSFTTLAFSNANNVTFGTSAGSIITASVAAPGAAAENNAINLLGANTAGNTTATGSTIGWSGVNLTLSGTNASQVVISAPATSSLVGTSGMSISSNGSTISVYPMPMSRYINADIVTQAATAQVNTHASVVPMQICWPLAVSNVRLGMSIAAATTTNNSSAGMVMSLSGVLYTRNGSTLSSVNSCSNTYSAFYTSNATASFAGARGVTMDFASSTIMTPGEYWFAVHVSTNTAAATSLAKTISMAVVPSIGTAMVGMDPFGAATAATRGALVGLGRFGSANTVATMAFSDIQQTGNSATAANLWVDFRNYSIW